ncbi:LamG domain-containing protein [Candidatus Poribacteria bacterium]|nr:LamG domain-containing protein [Candidatus Poribacteria bacterium]
MSTQSRTAKLCASVIIMRLVTISSYAAIDPKTIAAAWSFDGNAKDVSGNGYDGKVEGGAKFVNGQFGQAIDLNGKDGWVAISKKIGTFQAITLSHWVQSTGREGQWRVFFNNDGWKAGDIHYQLAPSGQGKVEFSINGNPGGNDQFANFSVSGREMNKWIHIATAYSAKEKKIRFYINGELDAENNWGGNEGVLDVARIGSWSGGGREWQGILDDFIIFNIVLPQEDIKTLMNDGLEKTLSVQPWSKMTTTWGSIKVGY